jgi:ERCC4-type nuclease
MKIIIDIREQSLFDIFLSKPPEDLLKHNIQIEKQVLPLGDILFVSDEGNTICIIERKTLPDLFASIKDGRYTEQSYRLSNSTEYHKHNVFYLIEGVLRMPKEKTLAYATMTSLQLFKGFSVIRTSSQNETAELLITMATKICREFKKGNCISYSNEQINTNEIIANDATSNEIISSELTETEQLETTTITTLKSNDNNNHYCNVVKKVKKENITPENIGEIILCQIPGISSVTAIAIMRKFTSFINLIDELKINPDCLDNFTIETSGKVRKINKTSIENIKKYLLGL